MPISSAPRWLRIGVPALLALAIGLPDVAERGLPTRLEPTSGARPRVLFVCRNGVAMSGWSTSYFNRLAEERQLPQRAVSRAARGRERRGRGGARDPDRHRAAVHAACHTPRIERWTGFPPMREQYFPSRAALRARVEALIGELEREQRSAGRLGGDVHAGP